MAAAPPEAEALLKCLTSRLSEQRRSIEQLHRSLVEEITRQLDCLALGPAVNGAPPHAQHGNADLLAITPATNGDRLPNASRAIPESKQVTGNADSQVAVTGTDAPMQPDDDLQHWNKHKHNEGTFVKITEGKDDNVAGRNFVQKIVMGKRFEWFFGAAILSHIIIMTLETQYNGIGVGHDINYPFFDESKSDAWPGMQTFFTCVDYIFGVLYTIELLLKIIALNRHFCEAWNVLDVVIVGMWYVDTIAGNVELPIDTMLLRLLRLAKLLRLVKVFKTMRGFEQLFLMLTALKGSLHILLWVTVLLFSGLLAFALLLNQTLVAYYIENGDAPLETRQECFKYFGTFSRALFSMFEMTLANWTPIARFLVEHVTEYFCIFCILFKLGMGFAVIAVINGCFIKETFKLAEQDDTLMILQKDKERHVHFEKMMKLLDVADKTGSGTLTRQEFVNVCQDPEVDIWLGAQGLRVTDAGAIFDLIDTGTGQISKGELVMGARKLQGNARSLDVAKNQVHLEQMVQMITSMEMQQSKDMMLFVDKLNLQANKDNGSSMESSAGAASNGNLVDRLDAHKEELTSHIADMKTANAQANVKEELARILQELADLRRCLKPQSFSAEMPLKTPPAAASGQQITKPKVMCGCS